MKGRSSGTPSDTVVLHLETNVPNDLAVDGARHAVLQLEVHLGDGVLGKHRGVRDVTCEKKRVSMICKAEQALSGGKGGKIKGKSSYEWQQTQPCCGW